MLNSNNSYYKIKSICFCLLSPKKLVRLFILREVKPSPDSIRIKRLTVDNLFPPLRQNDASSRVSNTRYYRGNHSYSYSSSSRNLKVSIIALTWTDHWRILMVTTVMHTPWTTSTIHNGSFIPLTLNIVQPNLSTSLTKPCTVWSTDSRRIPKLTTDNSRIIYIPAIITNRSPAASVIDLHSALSRPTSSNQSQSC